MDRGGFLCIIMIKREHTVLLKLNYFSQLNKQDNETRNI